MSDVLAAKVILHTSKIKLNCGTTVFTIDFKKYKVDRTGGDNYWHWLSYIFFTIFSSSYTSKSSIYAGSNWADFATSARTLGEGRLEKAFIQTVVILITYETSCNNY